MSECCNNNSCNKNMEKTEEVTENKAETSKCCAGSACACKCENKKKESPFLSSEIKEDVPASKKKESPFLSSEVKDVSESNESSTKKQHEQIDEQTKENSVFNAVGKLYFKSSKTNKLETRGEGKFVILKDSSDMYRLLMIRDQVMLKGCNHYITTPLTKATQVKNSWIWTALLDDSDAEKKEEKTVYFATFKDEETSNLFEKKYNEAKDLNLKNLEAKQKINK